MPLNDSGYILSKAEEWAFCEIFMLPIAHY